MTTKQIRAKNAARAARAEAALKFYAGDSWKNDDPEAHMSDLLSDLMHYAHRKKLDFRGRCDFAEGTFEHELKHGEAI